MLLTEASSYSRHSARDRFSSLSSTVSICPRIDVRGQDTGGETDVQAAVCPLRQGGEAGVHALLLVDHGVVHGCRWLTGGADGDVPPGIFVPADPPRSDGQPTPHPVSRLGDAIQASPRSGLMSSLVGPPLRMPSGPSPPAPQH